ncbi:hypothetical protein SASPL_150387 [Salvia splendens]|uniref:Transcriptional coactivator p15 (PC4) C-terminal domain-containing protein n=1 Tax=Salvia splendens TaxID=180675 RepID=A0A8X8W5Y5_SALSN|nr:hypothetical protein SASPL_150387 [Salvia splendens]
MSNRGKKREEEGALSEGNEPPKKISKPDNDSDDPDQIVVCELSKNRKVSVRNWQGKVVVDIREFYSKDGKEFPGKKETWKSWKACERGVELRYLIVHGPVENS